MSESRAHPVSRDVQKDQIEERAGYEIQAKYEENEIVRDYVVGIVNVQIQNRGAAKSGYKPDNCDRGRGEYEKQRRCLVFRLNHFATFSYSARRFSIRRSGMSQMMATVT